MRRIRSIDALEILLQWNRKGFYHVHIKYGLIPPKRTYPGEDGILPVLKTSHLNEKISAKDFLHPEYSASKEILSIKSVQSRD